MLKQHVLHLSYFFCLFCFIPRGRKPGSGRKNGGAGSKGKDKKLSGTESEQEVRLCFHVEANKLSGGRFYKLKTNGVQVNIFKFLMKFNLMGIKHSVCKN